MIWAIYPDARECKIIKGGALYYGEWPISPKVKIIIYNERSATIKTDQTPLRQNKSVTGPRRILL